MSGLRGKKTGLKVREERRATKQRGIRLDKVPGHREMKVKGKERDRREGQKRL